MHGFNATVITSFFSTLDLTSGTLRYAVAGHPAPLMIRSGGEITMLEGRGLMLGVQPNVQYQTYEATLDVGSGLLLYTDGIVEPSRNYLQGWTHWRIAANRLFGSAAECRAGDSATYRIEEHVRDDAAILFVGVTQLVKAVASTSHSWSFDAKDEGQARRVKRALLWRLGQLVGNGSNLSDAEVNLR